MRIQDFELISPLWDGCLGSVFWGVAGVWQGTMLIMAVFCEGFNQGWWINMVLENPKQHIGLIIKGFYM